MTSLIPDSYGVEFLEFNNCHDPADGQFAVKGQGRCLGIAARKAVSKPGEFAMRRAALGPLSKMPLWRGRMAGAVRRLPAYMRKDARDAWNAERTIVRYGPAQQFLGLDPSLDMSPASASQYPRTVLMADRLPKESPLRVTGAYGVRGYGKDEQLTVLRHELGHLDQTPIGRFALFGARYPKFYVEEVRAWKNAIRNSRGRVDFGLMQDALASYAYHAVKKVRLLKTAGNAAERKIATLYDDLGQTGAAQEVARRHTVLLRRYARKVRAAKAA